MRNFMGYDRRWLDEPHVGDHVGRTIWALGEILATAWIPALAGPARTLLDALVPSLRPDVSLRTAAYTVLGLARLDPDRLDRDARQLLERLVEQLASAYRDSAAGAWLWFDDRLSYDNARLPQALIVGGSALRRPADVAIGLESLAWLGDECGLADGMLRLPGHHGRDRDEPAPGEGDEQPLDATAFVEAELAALVATGDAEHGSRARNAFDWFLGRNRLDRPLYDFATGGCSDGLGRDRPERKRGRGVHARLPSRAAAPRRRGSSGPRPAHASGQGGVMPSHEVFRRHAGNPILTAGDWSEPVNAVFNPAAAIVDGETVVLARVEDRRGISHLGVARSADGLSGWSIAPEPLLAPAEGVESEQWGFEDPRAVWVGELERWVITCTAYGPSGPAVYLATTTDFRRSSGSGSSASPRTRTRRFCRSGSTDDGSSSTVR